VKINAIRQHDLLLDVAIQTHKPPRPQLTHVHDDDITYQVEANLFRHPHSNKTLCTAGCL
jgi:hypothetical protein